MFYNPFREEAAASRNERQQLDHLLRITAPHERIILVGIALVLVGFVLWALLGSTVRSVTFNGVLIEAGARHDVISSEPGHLVEILVAPGDRIPAGGPIARQTVPELDREIEALRERVDLLEAEIEEAGGDDGAADALLDSARTALLQIEARRTARAVIVSQSGGEVMALHAALGDYLPTGAAVALLRAVDNLPPQAVLQVAADMARRIRPGMPASVETDLPDGAAAHLQGTVASVTAASVPGWLAALLPAAAAPAHRVNVALDDASELAVPDGTPCRIRIELGRDTPAALLATGSS